MSDTGVVTRQSLSERVAEEVRVILVRRRTNPTQLARKLGVSQAYVWRRLDGRTAFDLHDLERIAAALGVDVADLLPTRSTRYDTAGKSSVIGYYPPVNDRPRSTRPSDDRPKGRPGARIIPDGIRPANRIRPPTLDRSTDLQGQPSRPGRPSAATVPPTRRSDLVDAA